jgi:predicted phage tail protein
MVLMVIAVPTMVIGEVIIVAEGIMAVIVVGTIAAADIMDITVTDPGSDLVLDGVIRTLDFI